MAYEGGCQCGKTRFTINSDPILAYCCHCTDCQRQSSSAFGMSVWFSKRTFEQTSGNVLVWKTKGDSGSEKSCAFCADCGTRLYHAFSDDEDVLSVKGGSLDDIAKLPLAGHIWTRSAQPWILSHLSAEACHETEPDDFEAFFRKTF